MAQAVRQFSGGRNVHSIDHQMQLPLTMHRMLDHGGIHLLHIISEDGPLEFAVRFRRAPRCKASQDNGERLAKRIGPLATPYAATPALLDSSCFTES